MDFSFDIKANYQDIIVLEQRLEATASLYESLKQQMDSTPIGSAAFASLSDEVEKTYQRVQRLQNELASKTTSFSEGITSVGTYNNTFSIMTNGAKDAEQATNMLMASMKANDQVLAAMSQNVSTLEQQNAKEVETQRQLNQELINYSVQARSAQMMGASLGNSSAAAQQADAVQKINTAMGAYADSTARATATANAAFQEQKNYVDALSAGIAQYERLMNDAVKAGNIDAAGEIAKNIDVYKTKLEEAKGKLGELGAAAKQAEASMKDVDELQKNVSQTSSVWGSIKGGISAMGEGLQNLGSRFVGFLTGNGQATESIKTFGKALDATGIPFTSAIKSIKAMTKASLSFLATPVGAVIGAIVLALKAFKTWLDKSAKGQKVMTVISAYLGSVMQSLTDILVVVGDYLYSVFAENIDPLKEYFSTMVKVVKDAFKIVWNIISGFGTALGGIWDGLTEGNWDGFTEGISKMWDGIKSTVDLAKDIGTALSEGWKAAVGIAQSAFSEKNTSKLTKDLGNIISNFGDNASNAAKLALEEKNAQIGLNQAKEETLRLDTKIAEKMNEMYKLQGAEKQAAINELKELKAHRLDKQIEQAKKLAAIQDRRTRGYTDANSADATTRANATKYHTVSLEQLASARNARMQVYQLEAQQKSSLRMLSRQEGALERSMASKAKSAANKERTQGNAVITAKSELADVVVANAAKSASEAYELQQKIEKARIDAMEDGVVKRKALRQLEMQNELEEIEQAAKKAVSAERERQKKEFEAQQKVIKAQGGKIAAWDDSMLDQEALGRIKKKYEELAFYMQQNNAAELYTNYKGGNKAEKERKEKVAQIEADIAQLEILIKKLTEDGDIAQAEIARTALAEANRQHAWVTEAKDAWNAYFQEYGTFLERRRALQEQFEHETAGMATSSPEYLTKQRRFEEDLSTLTLETFKKEMDWDNIFGDLSRLSKAALDTLATQIETLIKKEKTLSVKAIDELRAALEKVRQEQTSKGNIIAAAAGISKLRAARRAKDAANKEVNEADGGELIAQYRAAETTEEREKVRGKKVTDPTDGSLTTFGKLLDRAADAVKRFMQAQDGASRSIQSAGKGLSQIAQLGNSVGDLLGQFGVDLPEGFSTAFSGLGQMGNAMEAFDVTKPGSLLNITNYVKFASGLTSVFTGIADGLAELFGGNDSIKDYEDAAEELEKMSSLWDTLIAKKKEYAELSFGDTKKGLLADAVTAAEANLKALQDTAEKYGKAHTWNAHSHAYRSDRAIGSATFAQMSQVLGRNITTVQDLLNLTNDELVKLMEVGGGDWWTKLDDTQRDYIQQIADANDEIQDLNDSIAATAQGITFDDMVQSFGDAMRDMNKTYDDFVDEITDKMRNAVIDDAMDGAEDELKALYQKYKDLAEKQGGKLTAEQIEQRKEDFKNFAQKWQDKRDESVEAYGLDESTTEENQKNSYATASEDSIEELNGRMLANNEALYSIRALLTAPLTENAPIIAANVTTITGTLNVIREAMKLQQDIRENSYLELQSISQNTRKTAEALSTANIYLEKVYKNTKNN